MRKNVWGYFMSRARLLLKEQAALPWRLVQPNMCLPLHFIFKHFCRTCGFTVCLRRRIRPSWNWLISALELFIEYNWPSKLSQRGRLAGEASYRKSWAAFQWICAERNFQSTTIRVSFSGPLHLTRAALEPFRSDSLAGGVHPELVIGQSQATCWQIPHSRSHPPKNGQFWVTRRFGPTTSELRS